MWKHFLRVWFSDGNKFQWFKKQVSRKRVLKKPVTVNTCRIISYSTSQSFKNRDYFQETCRKILQTIRLQICECLRTMTWVFWLCIELGSNLDFRRDDVVYISIQVYVCNVYYDNTILLNVAMRLYGSIRMYVWLDILICGTLLVHLCDTTDAQGTCVTWFTVFHVWHDPFVRVMCLIHLVDSDMHSFVSFHTYELLLVHIWMVHVAHIEQSCHTYE